jgi:hypothetical protein
MGLINATMDQIKTTRKIKTSLGTNHDYKKNKKSAVSQINKDYKGNKNLGRGINYDGNKNLVHKKNHGSK